MKRLSDLLTQRTTDLKDLYGKVSRGEPIAAFVPSGFRALDQAGFGEMGTLAVLLGHSGEGKSALMLQLMEAAAKADFRVLAFLMEDPAEMVADRYLSRLYDLDPTKLRRIEEPNAMKKLQFLDDFGSPDWMDLITLWDYSLPSDDMLACINAHLAQPGPKIGLIVVDYMQIFTSELGENAERVINKMTMALNTIAKQHKCFVLVTSQLKTNEVMNRGDKEFTSWRFRHKNEDPGLAAVMGYRPKAGDQAWASQVLTQKARAIWSIFRPAKWLARHDVVVSDDTLMVFNDKSNYTAEMVGPVTLRWDGTRLTISEPKIGDAPKRFDGDF